ncbi:hypothetical protein NDU88_011006 [Pleurodeles waltl]|uniref:Uncharacterized protein n=1 Tax=Pleurodeles waltl TaxID=8319 RepID=A0AAV7S450_PLEWA|nr:hypothetical protein NDU88_011006 [Pleurodeles waltl]
MPMKPSIGQAATDQRDTPRIPPSGALHPIHDGGTTTLDKPERNHPALRGGTLHAGVEENRSPQSPPSSAETYLETRREASAMPPSLVASHGGHWVP